MALPKLERQVGGHREPQLTEAQTSRQKPLRRQHWGERAWTLLTNRLLELSMDKPVS